MYLQIAIVLAKLKRFIYVQILKAVQLFYLIFRFLLPNKVCNFLFSIFISYIFIFNEGQTSVNNLVLF